jgi:hypothetical protein
MATYSDWVDRFNRLKDRIGRLEELAGSFEKHTRSTNELVNSVQKIESELGSLQNKIQDAEDSAATFDREFLERKQTFPQPFQPDKLYTIQDFTLFLIVVSYCLFIVALALTFEAKTNILLGGIALALFLLGLLYRYA